VFLGFSHLQKGYKFYSPTTKRYYMSTDVTFFEETPFFSSSIQNYNFVQEVLSFLSFNLMVPSSLKSFTPKEIQPHSPANNPPKASPLPFLIEQHKE